jgi:VanZ family protein
VTVARRTAVFAALALLWAAVIFAVSSSSNPFPFVPRGLLSQDKLIHAVVYGVLGALVRVALGGTRLRPGVALLVALAAAAIYGASDEFHQMYVPNREASSLDLAADAIGALLGAVVAGVALRRQGRGASIAA